ncbi:hypothetical protein Salat_0218500 [Sesamum alatum]|uniref:Uncharacterized protein n=1 Tax=Sesamum alatum TaxID=300844 RepID=A0AAE1YYJ6_9LAMI|nr:hypothetical protein Salat_0218500 [Sesamum alatum]
MSSPATRKMKQTLDLRFLSTPHRGCNVEAEIRVVQSHKKISRGGGYSEDPYPFGSKNFSGFVERDEDVVEELLRTTGGCGFIEVDSTGVPDCGTDGVGATLVLPFPIEAEYFFLDMPLVPAVHK